MIEPLELRPEVAAFAQLMERALRDNDHKGGWQECSLPSLIRRLGEETAELDDEIEKAGDRVWRDWDPEAHAKGSRPHQQLVVSYSPVVGWRSADPHAPRRFQPTVEDIERIGSEAADVANFAMMIADNAGALK